MREIKFRAYDKVLGLQDVEKIDFDTCIVYVTVESQTYELSIENANLMQYTGLKDKKGKEIYEKDIIKGKRLDYYNYDPEEQIVVIEWDKISASFWPFSNNQDECPYPKSHEVEIIGNIYENQELLEK